MPDLGGQSGLSSYPHLRILLVNRQVGPKASVTCFRLHLPVVPKQSSESSYLSFEFFFRAVDGWANTCGVFICIITVFFFHF